MATTHWGATSHSSIIRRNHGANHLVVGRDHAGPGNDSKGNPIYGPYDAQELVEKHSEELGVTAVPFQMLVYLPEEDRYEEVTKVDKYTKTASISGTQVREQYLHVPAQCLVYPRAETGSGIFSPYISLHRGEVL